MTAADKLRELLASRPAMPNTEELVRWWRSSAALVPEVLAERDVLKQEIRELEQQRDSLGSQLAEACDLAERYKDDSEHNERAAIALRAERSARPPLFDIDAAAKLAGRLTMKAGDRSITIAVDSYASIAERLAAEACKAGLDGKCPAGFVCVHEVKCHGG